MERQREGGATDLGRCLLFSIYATGTIVSVVLIAVNVLVCHYDFAAGVLSGAGTVVLAQGAVQRWQRI